MSLTKQQIREIEDRLARASKGPWIYQIGNGIFIPRIGRGAMGNIIVHLDWKDSCSSPMDYTDTQFMAHSREDIELLLGHIRELELRGINK